MSDILASSCSVPMMPAQHRRVSFMLSHHAGSVKVFGILRLPVKSQKGVGIACRSVTQPIALLQQTKMPNHLSTLQSIIEVLLHSKGLK